MERKAIIVIFIAVLLAPMTSSLLSAEEPGGIGLEVLQLYHHERKDHRGPVVVLNVLPNGTALSAGVKNGDIITHIDGEPTRGKDFTYIVEEMLRGPIHTNVDLTIRRTSSYKTFNIILDRVSSKGLY